MSNNTDLEVRKREIDTLVDGVIGLERALRAKGIDAVDPEDRMEARDIIARIERRMLAKLSIKQPAVEAAE